MALCLAISLVARRDFVLYDQLVRYKWWYRNGYISSTGKCFDIGESTRISIHMFESRQKEFAKKNSISLEEINFLSDNNLLEEFKVNCSAQGNAGNGALMRLASVLLFFNRFPEITVEYSGRSGFITHGDTKAVDAYRYYGALIIAVMNNTKKDILLSKKFYDLTIKQWLNKKQLHPEIDNIANGSFQRKKGYDDGIRGKGYIVNALEAALWTFWSTDSFEKGVLSAVILGDDTGAIATIYGHLAGVYYGYSKLRLDWIDAIYAKEFMQCLCELIACEGDQWRPKTEFDLQGMSVV
ncbi:unnamed protein product [Rotaria sp. Silwood2]|nr:unnamed protein product [Rotaria sp. Silwood2]CAF4632299.1 unnamed protein product [Rotaria sp. Silwood2]